ncbi:1,3-beta-galactosyl-N-acetylhexosamine phosphorylase [Tessaracoccus sp. ZS01]|uniref:1,3-beta-galactosyl-N-acetylhexosamine phosphorylase n=1 Tax=Tessaracoccus sp. ZS01 TaxID=1906324 RepID=UPI00096E991B|nr:1,3-beta-galactosyl-N-acetylhexosamine phosphorylase [Tessaracoccus sp. ZS01]MCG6566264.1 1,3-beta-galactosyl-N-acetylhexosamine phosphorylase [Tessaracoccus sp. ZS01]OMG58741.1 1,3-beta-galactosyl-N-acetylhexosamine phosphorylase [Tessaracoccus sp. ZS01]
MNAKGRVTLPIEQGMDDQLPGILARLGADAVRNSDGTWLPEITPQLGVKVYETYFPARGQQAFAEANLDARPRFYLMSERVAAPAEGPLSIEIMKGYYELQVEPDQGDVQRWWEVIDRTTGEVVPVEGWTVEGSGADVSVTVAEPVPFHVYTVNFLAWQVWDSTQMYNYITNNWWDDESRVREVGYDARHPVAWEFMKSSLRKWCEERTEVDVVRFTTFFYHFTLVFNDLGKEKYVDWFGYSTSVNPLAMEAFEEEYGYRLRAEDFVDQGYYNSSFRVPSKVFRDWIEFTTRFVCSRVKELVDIVHEYGKEALMFLGDNWMGTEPYGELFAGTGIDGVVGSVGSSVTCRMISDIPGVKFTEGRFLPYFFPDVFRPGGDPLGEANESWLLARRAIARTPLDRIGYGGYLSLAVQFPDFMARVEQICDEFRSIHDEGQGKRPENAPIRIGVLNAWGSLRTWQTHMVAHALWYKQIYSYLGVMEALAGLPFDLKFVSFDEARDGKLADLDVVLNVGAAETAFSGGSEWLDESLAVALRRFVHQGGGLIGVGEPTAVLANGAFFQLSDVFGVDKELGLSQSTDRYPVEKPQHFITAHLDDSTKVDVGEGAGDIFALNDDTRILRLTDKSVDLAAKETGNGRAVYAAGLPYSHDNARLLHRAIYWAAGRENDFDAHWIPSNPGVEIAVFPDAGRAFVMNNLTVATSTAVSGRVGGLVSDGDITALQLDLEPMESRWIDLA